MRYTGISLQTILLKYVARAQDSEAEAECPGIYAASYTYYHPDYAENWPEYADDDSSVYSHVRTDTE